MTSVQSAVEYKSLFHDDTTTTLQRKLIGSRFDVSHNEDSVDLLWHKSVESRFESYDKRLNVQDARLSDIERFLQSHGN